MQSTVWFTLSCAEELGLGTRDYRVEIL